MNAIGGDPVRGALDHREGMAHHRMLLGRLHQRPGDEVCERGFLGAAGGLEGSIETSARALQLPNRNFPESGGGGNGEALVHVLNEAGRWALDQDGWTAGRLVGW